jgi:hypothetical protein
MAILPERKIKNAAQKSSTLFTDSLIIYVSPFQDELMCLNTMAQETKPAEGPDGFIS